MAVWVLVCALSAAVGAAGVMTWHAPRTGAAADSCSAPPVDESTEQTELTRTRLALAQEAAARAAVQKTADSAAADVARLNAELQFLHGQSKTKPLAQAAPPRR